MIWGSKSKSQISNKHDGFGSAARCKQFEPIKKEFYWIFFFIFLVLWFVVTLGERKKVKKECPQNVDNWLVRDHPAKGMEPKSATAGRVTNFLKMMPIVSGRHHRKNVLSFGGDEGWRVLVNQFWKLSYLKERERVVSVNGGDEGVMTSSEKILSEINGLIGGFTGVTVFDGDINFRQNLVRLLGVWIP